MEIKNKHQLIAAAGLIFLIGATLWPPTTHGAGERLRHDVTNPLRRSADVIAQQLSAASTSLHTVQHVEDALKAYHDREDWGDGPAVIVGEGVPAVATDYISQRMREHWTLVGRAQGAPVIVAVHLDAAPLPATPPARTRSDRIGFRIVPVLDGNEQVCVYLIDIGPASLAGLASGRGRPQNVFRLSIGGPHLGLSTCAFYAAFGSPGPAVGEWLDRTGNQLSSIGLWEPGATGNTRAEMDLNTSYWVFGEYGLACLGGDLAGCSKAVHTPGTPLRNQPGFRVNNRPSGTAFYRMSPYYLADMVQRLGPERFGRFWSSDLPFEEAFREAAGEDLGSYTRRWAMNTVGSLDSTGNFNVAGVLIMVLVAGVSIAGAGWVGVNRTV